MADVIIKYQGTINEFMGDGILVYFGAPTLREDDAKRAVACACAMQLAMGEVNEKLKEKGFPPLEMGIGINTGEVVVGNIGSEKRTKYTALGGPVNLTFRIESYTTGGQILISESTLKEVGSILRIDGQKKVRPKGVKEPITIYEVGGIGDEYNIFLPKEEDKFFTLRKAIPIQYTFLEGKHISDTFFKGSLVKLSALGALVSYDETPEQEAPLAFSNIKLNLLTPDNPAETSEDIYAKVLEKPTSKGSFYIRFTSLPPSVIEKLETLYKVIKATG
jgi:adenylate cyclase